MGAQNEQQPLSERLDLFENEFKAGNVPKLEDYVFADSDIFEVIEFLHIDLEQRFRLGQKLEVKDYILKYPKIQNHLNEVLELLKREIYWLSEKNLNPGMEYYVRSYESLSKELTLYFLEKGYSFPEINGFCVLEKIGQGGMGEVYKARQISLSRDVAIKIIRYDRIRELSESEEYRKNFQKEGQTLASINHENVVKIYDAGQYQENLHLVMEYLEGESLQKRIQKEGYLNPKLAAEMVEKIARGLSEVHKKGVIHRDLKPDNIFITLDGVPKVLDFGLARTLENADGRTKEWVFKGTPEYSSPEQSSRDGKEISVQTDVYGLGAVLYACLTGISPFPKGRDVLEVLRMVKQQEVVPVLAIRPICPKDLETICLKCLRKDPKQRYSSVIELAEDLKRYQSGMPILARPVSYYEKLSKWVARNPLVSAASSIAVIALITGTIISTLFGFYAKHQASIALSKALEIEEKNKLLEISEKEAKKNESLAKANQKIAEEQKRRAENILYINRFQKAYSQFNLGHFDVASNLLSSIPFKFRGWEHNFLYTRINQNHCTYNGHTLGVQSVIFFPNSNKIISGSEDNKIIIWDCNTGEEIQILSGHSDIVSSLCMSPDGAKIVSGSWDKTIKIWDAKTGNLVNTLTGHVKEVTSVRVSPDGKKIVSGSGDKTVKVWNAITGQEIQTLKGHSDIVSSLCMSPDGVNIVSGSWDKTIKIWDAITGQEIQTLKGHLDIITSVCMSPDGMKIVSGSLDKTLKIWNVMSGQEIFELNGHSEKIASVCISPDGKKIISGGWDNMLKVWDCITNKAIFSLEGHNGPVSSVCMSPDGANIVSGGWDNTLKIWNVMSGQEIKTLKGHSDHVESVCISPDGTKIVSGSRDKTIKIWDAITGQEIQTLKGHSDIISSVCMSPDGTRIVSGSWDKTIKIWDAITGQEIQTLKGHSDIISSVCMSPDGTRIVSGSSDNTLKIWDLQTGKEMLVLKGHVKEITGVSFSPDGKRIVSSGNDDSLKIWDPLTGQEILSLNEQTYGFSCLCFSLDGKKFISGSSDGNLRIWEGVLANENQIFKGYKDNVTSVHISPDFQKLLIGTNDNIKLWDVSSDQEILSVDGNSEEIFFSPDQTKIVGINDLFSEAGESVTVWDGGTGREILTIKGFSHIDFNLDGKKIVVGNSIWDANSGNRINYLTGDMKNQPPFGKNHFFSSDGKYVEGEDRNGNQRLWDSATGVEIEVKEKMTRNLNLVSEPKVPEERNWYVEKNGPDVVLVNQKLRKERILRNNLLFMKWAKSKLVWYREKSDKFEKNKEWFAAAFHLRKIIEIEPNNEPAKKRLKLAEDNLIRR